MMATRKIQATKNYKLFKRHEGENRNLDLKKHKKLMESMKLYGFLPCYPIICYRDKSGSLVVKDGQHRLTIAESLGLAVYWIEEEVDFDVAIVNSAQKAWAIVDYAQKFAANGYKDYQEGLEFVDAHGLPIGVGFALLAGTTTFSNVDDAYRSGDFKIKDRKWAEAVAGIYGPIVAMSPLVKNARFLEACMGVCRVQEFEAKRLIHSAEQCRDKLQSFSTREAYLEMIEDIYNFRRSKLVGLKTLATMAMRERNAAKKSKKEKETNKAAA